MPTGPQILWVDDDLAQVRPYLRALADEGFDVLTARTVTQAKALVKAHPALKLAILDVMIPLAGQDEESEFFDESERGTRTGVALARWIRTERPTLTVVGMSVRLDEEVRDWFAKYGAGFVTKLDMRETDTMVRFVKRAVGQSPLLIRIFIVHGHDEKTKWDLKNYLQNTLGLPEPIILHEQPSLGRTLIEKFEAAAAGVDVVFVLLTPDDPVSASNSSDLRRARQNVILELGYFLGRLGRASGKVILLYRGLLDLPSDIAGLAYVNVDGGVPAAGEEIRRELRSLVPV